MAEGTGQTPKDAGADAVVGIRTPGLKIAASKTAQMETTAMNTTHTPGSVPSVVPFTTDILAEPISQGGLSPRYQVLGSWEGNDTGILTLEALIKRRHVPRLEKDAAKLGLAYETVPDVNGLPWQIFEVQGHRSGIEAMARLAETMAIRRTELGL
jgi:hypothetical protein